MIVSNTQSLLFMNAVLCDYGMCDVIVLAFARYLMANACTLTLCWTVHFVGLCFSSRLFIRDSFLHKEWTRAGPHDEWYRLPPGMDVIRTYFAMWARVC